ncbi:signal recognition particle-docking protein FtsY [Methanocorpusculum vombati]|uniref:Signal recognition particle receptor FtsY n=1 Tax=Methanocorpusculum vombati TaxID=3002864 RepID=A0ABT4IJU4_9EURY|nr:signal recognition particle-docking protein FtsY [Methanocorpusculum vombati]MCZ9319471.1 signal recognition particle-docking protein FtsY [Methanocorpusculum sp.]MCZ0862013.1 signal recognition particle-docking protein FtsY [Methanocorpusculum vombati]MDE2520408.1 signal recognition particle-docking protein FtsY [Methanocorpusculum sp.]MDE2534077.1 signal recognition particle-docking protein FtsY [Methanocorpusculum sp.]MDE2546580.1 signal recognition particle-docking protein FtsY [Methano
MFEGLKKKLGGITKKLGKSVESASVTTEVETDAPLLEAYVVPDTPEPAGIPEAEAAVPAPVSVPSSPVPSPSPAAEMSVSLPAEKPDADAKKPGFFGKLKTLVVEREFVLSEKDIDETLFELQMVLLESDVAFPVAEAITDHMKKELIGTHRKIRESPEEVVTNALRHAIEEVLGDGFDLVGYIKAHDKPVKILFTGVNGTGKTTSVAKIAYYLQGQGLSVVVGAGDTFRAGAIEQIRVHCDRLGIKLISHQEGADPSAVLYDTVEYAKAHNIDVVLADSAGRFHNRVNLMNQLEKIKRVMKPDLVFYVDEAVAGNDAVIRAEEFEKTVSTNGVILTKVDMDPKGGAAISIAYTIGKPLVFLGVGQEYSDMKPFTPALIIDEIFGDEE